MSKERVVRIKTHDTEKVYEFPGENPILWEVTLGIRDVCVRSGEPRAKYDTKKVTIYLERETLEDAGLLPFAYESKREDPVDPIETPEDLLLRLLDLVGVYPVENY